MRCTPDPGGGILERAIVAYILFRRRPNAAQTFNNFRIASTISDAATGDRKQAEKILALTYYKSIRASVASQPRKIVPILPPSGDGLWSWNRSFEIACEMASQWCDDEIPLLVPDNADIHIGVDLSDLDEVEREKNILDVLDELDFDVEVDFGAGSPANLDDAVFKEMFDKEEEEAQRKWLSGLSDEIDRMDAALDGNDIEQTADEADDLRFEPDDISAIISEAEAKATFSAWLSKTLEARNLTPAALARSANMLASTVKRLASGIIVVPTKSHICAIGLALGLPRSQFDAMLAIAGYTLSPSVPRDMVVAYYIDKRVTDIGRINRTLFVNNIPTLGAHKVMPK